MPERRASFLPFSTVLANINNMQPEELKLLELLQADEEAGTIYFKNRRMLIFDVSNATGLYNLMRNIGGSIGISAVTTLWRIDLFLPPHMA